MTRAERVLLIAFFAGVLALLVYSERNATAIGAAVGLVAGVVVAEQLHQLNRRIDQRLGADPVAPRSFTLRRPLLSAGVHVALLSGLLLLTVVIPFVGGRAYAVGAGALTTMALVVTAGRLRS